MKLYPNTFQPKRRIIKSTPDRDGHEEAVAQAPVSGRQRAGAAVQAHDGLKGLKLLVSQNKTKLLVGQRNFRKFA
jgi:hypothetical protein